MIFTSGELSRFNGVRLLEHLTALLLIERLRRQTLDRTRWQDRILSRSSRTAGNERVETLRCLIRNLKVVGYRLCSCSVCWVHGSLKTLAPSATILPEKGSVTLIRLCGR